jgi:hypothetical protein
MEEAESGASTLNASDDVLSGSRDSPAILALATFAAAPPTAPEKSHNATKWSSCMISEFCVQAQLVLLLRVCLDLFAKIF